MLASLLEPAYYVIAENVAVMAALWIRRNDTLATLRDVHVTVRAGSI